MLLQGKKLLVTGVLLDTSIAFHVARLAQEQGAEVVLTSFGRTMKLTSTIAKRLPVTPAVVELEAEVWIRLGLGESTWADAESTGRLRASGERSNLSAYLPLLSL